MSIACEKAFTLEVTSLDWTKISPETPPSVVDEIALSNRFAIDLTSGYSPLDLVTYESEIIGPFAEERTITVAGTVNFPLHTDVPGAPVTLLFLDLREQPGSIFILSAHILKSEAQLPFTGPCGFTYDIPIGDTVTVRAGLTTYGIGNTNSVDMTITVTITPP